MAVYFGTVNNDVYNGSATNDTIFGAAGDDLLYGNAGDDIITGNAGKDRLYGGAGSDQLNGSEGDDQLFGEDGNDRLLGGIGNDLLNGGLGDDQLLGEDGNDTLAGGKGVDTLDGRKGDDTFLFNLGDGKDRVTDGVLASDLFGLNDHLKLGAGIQETNVVIGRNANDLLIGIKGNTADQITVTSQFLANAAQIGVEKISLGDNTYVTKPQLNTLIQNMSTFAASNGISLSNLTQVQNNATLMTMIATAFHP